MRCADSFLSCCIWSPFGLVDFDIWLENCQKRTIAALAWHTVLLAVLCVFNYMWFLLFWYLRDFTNDILHSSMHRCTQTHAAEAMMDHISVYILSIFSIWRHARAHAHTRTRTFCKHVCEHVGINSLLCVLMACALKPFFGWSGRKKIEGRTGMIQSEDPIFCSKWS